MICRGGGSGAGLALTSRRYGSRCCGLPDIRLDHDIGGAADQQQMLHVVAPDQHQTPAAIDAGGIDHGEAGLAAPRAHDAQISAGESPHQVAGRAKDRENDDEGEQELHRNGHVVEEGLHRSAPFPPCPLLQQVGGLTGQTFAIQMPGRHRLAAPARLCHPAPGSRYCASSIRAMK
jgi:hypothetical protein